MNHATPLMEEFRRLGKSVSCPIIDMHGHFGPFNGIFFPNVTAEQMVGSMDRAGVRLIVCSSHEALLVNSGTGNARMADVVRRFPDRFRAYWGVNPNEPDVLLRQLDGLAERKEFVGIKFLSDYHRYPITGDAYVPALKYAQEHRMPVLMHTWGGSKFDGPELVGEVADRYPDLVILMGHSGYGEWDVSISVAKKHPNVYLELTAAYAVNGVVEKFVNEAGSEKVLFGTDLPWFDPHYAAGCILYAHISDNDRHNIFHRNAERILAECGNPVRF